jgi:hypothetical protein
MTTAGTEADLPDVHEAAELDGAPRPRPRIRTAAALPPSGEGAAQQHDGMQGSRAARCRRRVGAAAERSGPGSDDAGLDLGDVVRGVGDELETQPNNSEAAIDATMIAAPCGPGPRTRANETTRVTGRERVSHIFMISPRSS